MGQLTLLNVGGPLPAGVVPPGPPADAILWPDGSGMTWPDGQYAQWPSGAVTLLTNLAGWYRNDGTDRSGNGADMTAIGSPTTTTGIGGAANAATSVSNTKGWTRASGLIHSCPFTLATWAKSAAGDPGPTTLLVIGDVPDYTRFAELFWGPSGDAGIQGLTIPDTPANGITTAYLDSPVDGSWTHIVFTVSDTNLGKMYVNGVLRDAYQGPGLFALAEPVTTRWFDPDQANGGAFSLQYGGVWTRELSADEVTQLYNGGAGYDPTA